MRFEINNDIIDKSLLRFRDDLDNALNRVGSSNTFKNSNVNDTYYQPYVPVHLAKYAYHHSSILRNVVECFTQDIFLNDYSLSDPDEDISVVDNVLNDNSNIYQLYLAGLEYFVYGYGALEVIVDVDTTRFKQIPAHTLQLRVVPFKNPRNGQTYLFYYAEQRVNGNVILLKLSNYDYSMLDDFDVDHGAVGMCIWIGGCNENEFFDIPRWVAKRKSLFTDMAIDEFNARKIEKGNVPAGVMLITGPKERPDPRNPDDVGIAEKLEKDLNDGTGGTVFTYLGNASSSRDIELQYEVLQDNNYEYLDNLQDRCLNDILRAFKMPKVRLAIDDMKESMNSNKSDTLYEIYNREIDASQLFIQDILGDFCRTYLGVRSGVVISNPEFADKTATRVATIIELFNSALLTLGQCLTLLASIYPVIDFNDGVEDDLLDTRFYGGVILGDSTSTDTGNVDELNNIIHDVNSILEGNDHPLLEYDNDDVT